RVDEAAAGLLPLRPPAQWPAKCVNDPVERLLDLPDLLHAQLPALRIRAAQIEVVERRAGEVPDRALREHGRPGDEIGARLEVGELLPVLAAPLVARPDPADDPVLDQQPVGRGLAEDVDARLLGLLAEEASEPGDGGDVLAV